MENNNTHTHTDTNTVEVKYPELEKMKRVQADSQIIGEFLEVMGEKGIFLAKNMQSGDNGKPQYIFANSGEPATLDDYMDDVAIENPEYRSWRSGTYPINESIEQILAIFFGIDLKKAEEEKREILATVRG